MPKHKPKKDVTIKLTAASKAELWRLVESWQGMHARLQKFASTQASEKDYRTASENALLSEGLIFCAEDLIKILPKK